METPSSQSSFLSGPILSPLIRFALPLMLSLLLQAFYGGVDLAVVGKFSPTASVSAVATGSQVMQSITSIITGLTMGVTPGLGVPGQLLVAGMMFLGRVGILSFSLAFLAQRRRDNKLRYPETNILVG